MKKLIRLKLIILVLSLSISSFGQYTGTFPNVAVNKTATAMDSIVGFEPSKAVDNSLATYCAIDDDAPAWLMIDLGSPHFIDGYGWDLPDAAELPKAYSIQGSLDGGYFRILKEGVSLEAGAFDDDIRFPGDYRYIKIEITEKDARASFSEVYLFGEEIEMPSPPTAQAATDITATGFKAHWSKRTTARGYIFELASDPDFINPVEGYDKLDVGDVLEYDVAGLLPLSTYFYRISTYNAAGTSSPSNNVSITTLNTQTISFDSIAAYTYGDADFELTATASSGLPVSFTSSYDSVASITGTTVSILGAGTTTITATQEGDADYEAADPVEWDLVVNLVELTIIDAVASSKAYDGTTDAVISGAVLNGVLGSEDVILEDETIGTFAQSAAGAGIVVTTSMTIAGADIANYSLTQPLLSADITVKELTVSGASAVNKVYDGTTAAEVSGAVVEGVILGDDVSVDGIDTGVFAQSGVGAGITVTTTLSLIGTDKDNYTLAQMADLSSDITLKELVVTAEDKSREACESNPDFTILYEGFVESEDASVLDPVPVAESAADENSGEGAYDIVVSGGGAVNYSLTYVTGILTVSPDLTDPELVVQNVTVQLDEDGKGSIAPADVVVSATDNCGVTDTTLTASTFTTEDIGEVTIGVTVLDAAGNSVSLPTTVTVEGPSAYDELLEIGARIYPNPTEGKLILDTETMLDGLKVMDMTGKTIINMSSVEMHETFDLSTYSNGIYVFQLQVGHEMKHIKVIKK